LKISRHIVQLLLACSLLLIGSSTRLTSAAEEPFRPTVGQEGKDVVWVPTPPVLVEKMLDLARVTPQDYVMDLGSGDGRNIIAAAKRGARGLGVEFNPKMVELATRTAQSEGVADKASFVQGDMYEADISRATVLALFLLPDNLRKLTPKFLDLKPGTRIVANHFGIDGWEADVTERVDGECMAWCTALLYIVPAKVAGTWRLADGELELAQKFQALSGTLRRAGAELPIENGKLQGNEIRFKVSGMEYSGRVEGDAMSGKLSGDSGAWKASRVAK
jgi:SAM-dependent methyltransferase